ncbi:GTPase [Bacillus anthracis str. UR-1]|nr:GTPase [Bacillus anthracis str. UR-1]
MGKNNIFAIQKIGYDKDTSSIFGGGDMANVVELH